MLSKNKLKTVLITGASSGIGAACAKEFARSGANLILTARRVERLEQLKDSLQSVFDVKIFVIGYLSKILLTNLFILSNLSFKDFFH